MGWQDEDGCHGTYIPPNVPVEPAGDVSVSFDHLWEEDDRECVCERSGIPENDLDSVWQISEQAFFAESDSNNLHNGHLDDHGLTPNEGIPSATGDPDGGYMSSSFDSIGGLQFRGTQKGLSVTEVPTNLHGCTSGTVCLD